MPVPQMQVIPGRAPSCADSIISSRPLASLKALASAHTRVSQTRTHGAVRFHLSHRLKGMLAGQWGFAKAPYEACPSRPGWGHSPACTRRAGRMPQSPPCRHRWLGPIWSLPGGLRQPPPTQGSPQQPPGLRDPFSGGEPRLSLCSDSLLLLCCNPRASRSPVRSPQQLPLLSHPLPKAARPLGVSTIPSLPAAFPPSSCWVCSLQHAAHSPHWVQQSAFIEQAGPPHPITGPLGKERDSLRCPTKARSKKQLWTLKQANSTV